MIEWIKRLFRQAEVAEMLTDPRVIAREAVAAMESMTGNHAMIYGVKPRDNEQWRGDQWSEADRQAMKSAGPRPPLAINRLPPMPPLSSLTPPPRYPKPAGKWTSFSDWELNRRLQSQGLAWTDFCAVEIWREDWEKPKAVFSSWLASCDREFAIGLHWRRLPHGELIPMTWH